MSQNTFEQKIDHTLSVVDWADEDLIARRLKDGGYLQNLKSSVPAAPLILVDLDEVMVNIGIKWMFRMRDLDLLPASYDNDDAVVHAALHREEYYFWKHVGLEKEDTRIYAEDSTFYDNLEATTYGQGIEMNALAGRLRGVILTHCVEGPVNESKKRFISKNFPSLITICIPGHTPKSKVINDMGLNHYVTFSDDSVKVVTDVLHNTLSLGKEFYMPKFGHNGIERFDPKDLEYMAEISAKLVYYENIL